MLVLGIETSCDETSAAVVEDGRAMLSNVISSQIALHAPFGGVVPEIASRQHVKAITIVVRRALEEAGITEREIDVVAATYGPGLAGALLVGLNFGRGYALGLGCPFVAVNHLEGHLHSVWVRKEVRGDGGRRRDGGVPLRVNDATGAINCATTDACEPELPMLALIVSGGHTELVLMRGHGEYELVGRTRDDAAGEAFDKVARLIGLPYPGGPAIQRVAAMATQPVRLPRAWISGTFDFSFSGLKTAVLHAVYETVHRRSAAEVRGVSLPRIDVAAGLTAEQQANLAAGFQESVVDVLVRKTGAAAESTSARSVAVVGGVAANTNLRARMTESLSVPVYISPPELATDNAAMIAAAAYFVPRPGDDVDVEPSLQLVS